MTLARNLLAVVALVAVSLGFGLERLSLGLIVPGVFVLACLVYGHGRRE
jgi:hypothetical protein